MIIITVALVFLCIVVTGLFVFAMIQGVQKNFVNMLTKDIPNVRVVTYPTSEETKIMIGEVMEEYLRSNEYEVTLKEYMPEDEDE